MNTKPNRDITRVADKVCRLCGFNYNGALNLHECTGTATEYYEGVMKPTTSTEWGDMIYKCSNCGFQHREAISCPMLKPTTSTTKVDLFIQTDASKVAKRYGGLLEDKNKSATSTHNEHHHHFVGGQCIVCKLPTTSTEWEKELYRVFYDETYKPRSREYIKRYDRIKDFISQALTTRTNELLGDLKMKKKQLHSVGGGDIGGYIDVPDDAYNRRVEIYNEAVDEFNEKLATLRQKYSV